MNMTALNPKAPRMSLSSVAAAAPQSRPASVRFGADADFKTPTLLQLLEQSLSELQAKDPVKATALKAQKEEFFGTFKEFAGPVLVLAQMRKSMDKLPIPIPSFLKSLPMSLATKELCNIGIDEEGLKAAFKRFDQANGDSRYKDLLGYCDVLAKKNIREFLGVAPKDPAK